MYIFAVLIYSEYEQLTQIYDNVFGTNKKKVSQYCHQIFNVFSNIANCFWKGVLMSHISVAMLWVLRNTPVLYHYNTQPFYLVTSPSCCMHIKFKKWTFCTIDLYWHRSTIMINNNDFCILNVHVPPLRSLKRDAKIYLLHSLYLSSKGSINIK